MNNNQIIDIFYMYVKDYVPTLKGKQNDPPFREMIAGTFTMLLDRLKDQGLIFEGRALCDERNNIPEIVATNQLRIHLYIRIKQNDTEIFAIETGYTQHGMLMFNLMLVDVESQEKQRILYSPPELDNAES